MLDVIFDLDGVLRDLCSAVWGEYPSNWTNTYKGINLYKYVKEHNYKPLLTAKSLPYIFVALSLPEVNILSCQPEDWRDYTMKWIKKYFKNKRVFYEFTETAEEKEIIMRKLDNFYLIDDYPFYSDYSRIILVDRPYNKNVKNPFRRVKTPDELRELIFD